MIYIHTVKTCSTHDDHHFIFTAAGFLPPNRRDRIQLLNFEEPPVWKTCHDAMMPERCFASILAKIVCSAWQGGVRQVIPGASVLVLKHQELDLLEKLSSNILGYLTRRG